MALVAAPSTQVDTLALVATGDRLASYLWLNHEGGQALAHGFGTAMPPDRRLPEDERAWTAGWIESL